MWRPSVAEEGFDDGGDLVCGLRTDGAQSVNKPVAVDRSDLVRIGHSWWCRDRFQGLPRLLCEAIAPVGW